MLVYSSRDLKQEILFTDILTVESNGSTQKGCSYPHTKEHKKVPLISLQEKYISGVIWKPIRTAFSKQLNTNMQMVQVLVLLQSDVATVLLDEYWTSNNCIVPLATSILFSQKEKKIYLILVPSKEKILKTTGRAEQLNRHLSSQQKIIPDVKINVKHRNIHICIVPFQHSLISTGSDDQTARHNAYKLDNVWTA